MQNFIDATLVARTGILIEEFEGFSVVVVDGYKMTCTHLIPQLSVTLGNYTFIDEIRCRSCRHQCCVGGSMAILIRKVLNELPDNGDGIHGIEW